MTAANATPAPILNAFVDDTDSAQPTIALIRRVDGVRTVERVECTWDALWKRADLRDVQGRLTPAGKALLRSGAQIEASGPWVRGRWAREVGRKHMDNALRAASHEADVDPIRRWFIDTGARVAQPRRAYFDLETDSRVPFNRKTEARILAWSIVSESGRSRSAVLEEDTDRAEAELLTGFWHLAHHFDQLLAWNGEGFDFPVIRARTARLAAMHVVDPSIDPADAVESPYAYLAGVDPREWLWLDHLLVYDRMNTAESGDEKTSLKLNNVAHALLGRGKNEFNASQTWQEWAGVGLTVFERRLARERLLDYCTQDTALLRAIEEKTGFVRLFQTLCEACNVLPDSRGLNPTQQVDGFLLKLADERGHHFPTRQYAARVEKFRGAYVMQPTATGIVKDVHVADFASLYPSIILSWNMSPETKLVIEKENHGSQPETVCVGRRTEGLHSGDDGGTGTRSGDSAPSVGGSWGFNQTHTRRPTGGHDSSGVLCSGWGVETFDQPRCATAATGTRFRTNVPGILPIALDELLRLRKEWNDRKSSLPPGTPDWYDADRRSTAYKVAANSFYGVMGSPYSRYFDRDVGEAVTQSGVWLIKETQAEAEKRGMSVIYADTDSIFVVGQGKPLARDEFATFVDWCNRELYPRILPERGCVANRIKLAYEKQFARLVFTSAKRYAGTYTHYKGKLATADSKPEIKGLEYKRGDAALMARRLQSEVINLFVSGSEDPALYRAIVERHKAHVLFDALSVEEVQLTKTLSKAIDEYVIKRKGKGADKGKTTIVPNPLAHVNIARQMRERGEEVGAGTRVGFVVRDGSKKIVPMHVSEFNGSNADRYYLWERLVYPPTLRLLAAMFPTEAWGQYHKVPRVNPAQLPLFT